MWLKFWETPYINKNQGEERKTLKPKTNQGERENEILRLFA